MLDGTPTLESNKEVSESASAALPSITRSISPQRRPTRHVIREKDLLHEHFLLFNPFPLLTRNYAPHVGILPAENFKKAYHFTTKILDMITAIGKQDNKTMFL